VVSRAVTAEQCSERAADATNLPGVKSEASSCIKIVVISSANTQHQSTESTSMSTRPPLLPGPSMSTIPCSSLNSTSTAATTIAMSQLNALHNNIGSQSTLSIDAEADSDGHDVDIPNGIVEQTLTETVTGTENTEASERQLQVQLPALSLLQVENVNPADAPVNSSERHFQSHEQSMTADQWRFIPISLHHWRITFAATIIGITAALSLASIVLNALQLTGITT